MGGRMEGGEITFNVDPNIQGIMNAIPIRSVYVHFHQRKTSTLLESREGCVRMGS